MAESDRRSSLPASFALICGITFVVMFSAFQLFPTVPLRLLELGARRESSGLFMAVFTAGSASGALFTGPLGDRVGQRRTMICSAFGFAIFAGLYGFVKSQWWIIVMLAFPHGVVWSGLLTATMPILGTVLPEDRRADGLSLYGLASPAGVVFGPMLGLAILRRFGFIAIASSLFLLFILIAALAFQLPKDSPQREHRSALGLPDASMLAPCLVLFTTALGYGVLGTFSAQEALKVGMDKPWLFLTCMALSMVSMRVIVSRTGFGRRPIRLLPLMLWMSFLGLATLALAPGNTYRHIISASLYGAGYSMMYTLVNMHVLETIQPTRRGAAFGAALFAFDSGIGLGALAIGHLIGISEHHFGALGFRIGWSASALMAFLALLLSYRMVRGTRRN